NCISQSCMQRRQYFPRGGHAHAGVAEVVAKLTNCARRKLRKFAAAEPKLSIEDVVLYVACVDRQHLARHTFVAAMPTPTMFEETLAELLDRHFLSVGPIRTDLHLAFHANAESIGGLFVGKVLALALSAAIGIVNHPCRLGFARGRLPCALTNG